MILRGKRIFSEGTKKRERIECGTNLFSPRTEFSKKRFDSGRNEEGLPPKLNWLKERLYNITVQNPLKPIPFSLHSSSLPTFGINYRNKLQIHRNQKVKTETETKKEKTDEEISHSLIESSLLNEFGHEFTFELDNTKVKEEVIEPSLKVEAPELKHGLERVLKSTGLHLLREHHFDTFRFDPFLAKLHQPHEIDYDALQEYVPAGKDPILHQLAKEKECTIKGSTSSVSTFMSHIYYLVSNFKPFASDRLSSFIQSKPVEFSFFSKKPGCIILARKDGIYSVDSPTSADSSQNILMDMGKSMECMLTMDPDEFNRKLLKVNRPPKNTDPQAYHYLKMGNCLFRSQLDCKWDGLPGPKKTFDLKTRSIGAIRYNFADFEQHVHKRLENIISADDSFESEYFDMIRSTFLKYNMQVRIGKMNGILVAYHNTAEIFGFEYVPQTEMDATLYGSSESGDFYFNSITKIFQTVIQTVTEQHSNDVIKLAFVTSEGGMHIFAQPIPSGGPINRGESLCGDDGFFAHEVFYYKLNCDVLLDGVVVSPMNISLKDNVQIKLSLKKLVMNSDLIFQKYQSIFLDPFRF